MSLFAFTIHADATARKNSTRRSAAYRGERTLAGTNLPSFFGIRKVSAISGASPIHLRVAELLAGHGNGVAARELGSGRRRAG